MLTPRDNLLKVFRHEKPEWIPIVIGHIEAHALQYREDMDPELDKALGDNKPGGENTRALTEYLGVDLIDNMWHPPIADTVHTYGARYIHHPEIPTYRHCHGFSGGRPRGQHHLPVCRRHHGATLPHRKESGTPEVDAEGQEPHSCGPARIQVACPVRDECIRYWGKFLLVSAEFGLMAGIAIWT